MTQTHKFGAVVLMGPPNAGKSTFLNTVVGQKVAIVTPKPQTTRNRISGIWTTDAAQVIFLDTPGVHRRGGRLNRMLLTAAWQSLAMADLAVLLVDAQLYAAKPRLMEDELAPLVEPVRTAGLPLLVAANKVDAVKDKPRLLPLIQRLGELFPEVPIHPVSALTGEGLEALLAAILAHLPEGPAGYPQDQVSTVSLRFMAAEVIREKLFLALQQELPYATAVEIEAWEEDERLARISAVIYCARATHKGIIIGKGGAALKQMGAAARLELEEMLEKKVFLELYVKVREDWTEDVGFLRGLGLGETGLDGEG